MNYSNNINFLFHAPYALKEVVHGRNLADCIGLLRFLHKSVWGVQLRKQNGSKLVRQTDR